MGRVRLDGGHGNGIPSWPGREEARISSSRWKEQLPRFRGNLRKSPPLSLVSEIPPQVISKKSIVQSNGMLAGL